MIDIIIPAYNAHDTLYKTLSSIALQTIKDKVNVYIINDYSKRSYKKEIDTFKDIFNLKEIKTKKRLGPGGARQYGIENSDSNYIMFIDADDQLYNPFVLNLLYFNIDKGYDIIIGKEVVNGIRGDYKQSNIHGKIYSRAFLKENNIKFNNTKYSEDNSFDQITRNITNNIIEINDPVYLYVENKNSLTSKKYKELEKLTQYLYNRIYTTLELQKRNVDPVKIANILLRGYTYAYLTVKSNKSLNNNKLYKKCYRYELMFLNYEKYLSENEILENLLKRVNCSNIFANEILKDFNKFRSKFREGKK